MKGPYENPPLIHKNLYVFGIIEEKKKLLIQSILRVNRMLESALECGARCISRR